MEKLKIDGETLYVCGLGNSNQYKYRDNSMGDLLRIEKISEALKPVVKVSKALKKGLQEMQPEEIELELQLQMAVSDDNLVFAIVNAGAEAHLSLKFVWKKDELGPNGED